MKELIAILIAMILMSLFFFGNYDLINTGKVVDKKYESEIKTRFSLILQGYNTYNLNERKTLPISNWKSEYQKYSSLPNDFKNMSWSYNSNSNGNYFCLSGEVFSENIINALNNIKNNYPVDSFYYNTNCGSTTNFSENPSISSGVQVSATFYIK